MEGREGAEEGSGWVHMQPDASKFSRITPIRVWALNIQFVHFNNQFHVKSSY